MVIKKRNKQKKEHQEMINIQLVAVLTRNANWIIEIRFKKKQNVSYFENDPLLSGELGNVQMPELRQQAQRLKSVPNLWKKKLIFLN